MKTYLHSKCYLGLVMPLVFFLVSCHSKPDLEKLICVHLHSPNTNSCYFFTDTLGNMMTKPQTGLCYDFYNGLARIQRSQKYGYMNGQGEMVVPLRYQEADDFTNGFAIVGLSKKKSGLINTKGEEVMPCVYNFIGRADKNGMRIVKDSTYAMGLFSEDGKEVFPCKYTNIILLKNGSIFFTSMDNRKYICTPQKDTIRLDQYEMVNFYNDSLAIVKYNNGDGVIDYNGNEIIPCTFKYLHFNKEGWTHIAQDKKLGWLHMSGKKIFMDVESRSLFSEGLAAVRLKGEKLYGFINTEGKMVIPPRYKDPSSFQNGIALVRDWTGKQVYIDREGTELDTVYIPTIYTNLKNNVNGVEPVCEWIKGRDKNSSIGCRSKDGKIIIPCEYKHLLAHPHWIEAVSADEKHYIYSLEGHFYFKY